MFKIGVHSGTFHADDLIFCALVEYEKQLKNHTILRTRDENQLKQCDIVGDVGMVYNGINRFDHHQNDVPYYDNGIKMAACGLYLQHMKSLSQEEKSYILENALYAVQAQDNGQNLDNLGLKLMNHPFSFAGVMNQDWKTGVNGQEQTRAFFKALEITRNVLHNLIRNAKLDSEAKTQTQQAFDKRTDGIVELSTYCPWTAQVIELNRTTDDKATIVLFTDTTKQWSIQVVPKEIGNFEAWVNIPESVEKLNGFIFRHKAAFLAKFTDHESALQAAKLTIQQ